MKKLFWASVVCILFTGCTTTKVDEKNIAKEYYNIANEYYSLKKNEKAAGFYIKALELDNELQSAKYNLVLIYTEGKKYKEAVYWLELLLEEDGGNSLLMETYAYLKYMQGDLEGSAELYTELLSLPYDSNISKMNLVKIYFQLERYDEGLFWINNMLDAKPELELYEFQAEGYYSLEQWESAALAYTRYLEMNAADSKVWFRLAECYENIGDTQERLNALIEGVRAQGESFDVLKCMDIVKISFLENQDLALGFEYLTKAIDANYTDKEALLELLKTPDLIGEDKVRQLLLNKKIIQESDLN